MIFVLYLFFLIMYTGLKLVRLCAGSIVCVNVHFFKIFFLFWRNFLDLHDMSFNLLLLLDDSLMINTSGDQMVHDSKVEVLPCVEIYTLRDETFNL